MITGECIRKDPSLFWGPTATDRQCGSCTGMRSETATPHFILVVATATFLSVVCLETSARADHVNVTGQGQKTPGKGPSNPENPAEGDKPQLPGDQPSMQGTDPSSPVHNIDPRQGADRNKHAPERTQ